MTLRARTLIACGGVLVAVLGFAILICGGQAADDGAAHSFGGALAISASFIGGLILFFGGALAVLGSMAAE